MQRLVNALTALVLILWQKHHHHTYILMLCYCNTITIQRPVSILANSLGLDSMNHSPLSELLVDKTIGKTFSTDSDPLQYPVTPQLMHDHVGINHSRAFLLVGDDAADKVRYCVPQSGHEVVERLLVELWGVWEVWGVVAWISVKIAWTKTAILKPITFSYSY